MRSLSQRLEHRLHQRRSDPPALALRSHTEGVEVVVRLARVSGVHDREPALGAAHPAAEHAHHGRQQADLLPECQRARARRHPERAAGDVLGGEADVARQVKPAQHDVEQQPRAANALLVVRDEPPHGRVLVERTRQHVCENGNVIDRGLAHHGRPSLYQRLSESLVNVRLRVG